MGQIFIQASNFGNLWQRGSFVYGLAIPSYPTPPSTSLMIDNERSGLVYVRTSDDSFNYFSNGTWHSISSGTGGGTVNSITAGTGLTGGTITTSGTIALATSGVTAGSYTSANITVDAFGRITTAANGSGGGGGVTSVGLTLPPTLFTITVSPITSSGSLTAVFVDPPAHSFFSGPTSGVSGQPTFRAIIASDLPSLSSTYVPFTGANQPIVLNDLATINDTTNNTPSIASNGRVLIDENQFPVTSWSIGSISPDPTLLPLVSIGDIGNNGNSTMLTVNDTNQNIIMQSSAITATSLATGTVTQMVTCTSAGILGFQSIPGGGGSGTVTSVTSSDVTTATVATTTTTPVITIVSAPKLQTARTINSVSFDGSANITVTAAAGTLTGTTLNSTVVTSSLTSVGTVTSGTLSTGTVLGGVTVTLGSDATGDLYYRNSGGVLTRLPIGSSTNVLTVSGGLPSWAAPSGGGVSSVTGTTDRITSSGGTTPVIDISASYIGQSSITTLGTITTGTWTGTTIAIANGGTGNTSLITAPTASTIVGQDANKNYTTNNLIESYVTTATSGGTTTLVVADKFQQYFTGSTTQTVQMPVESTLVTGQSWSISNNSTGVITINSSGGNLITTVQPAQECIVTCISTIVTTAAAWSNAITFPNTPFASYTPTYVGFTGSVTTNHAKYLIVGKVMYLKISCVGTSSATNFTLTLPSGVTPLDSQIANCASLNSGTRVNSVFILNAASNILVLSATSSTTGADGHTPTNYTNSGLKGCELNFSFEMT